MKELLRLISANCCAIVFQISMGDNEPMRPPPALPRLRVDTSALTQSQTQTQNPALSQSQTQAQQPPVRSVKLDIRDVVRREGYRADLHVAHVRTQRNVNENLRGTTREAERSSRRHAFWSHVNKYFLFSSCFHFISLPSNKEAWPSLG